jgi:DNA repair protein RadC
VKDCALYTGSRSAELAAHASLEKQRQLSSLIGLIRGADDAKSSAERLSRMFPRISGMLASDFYVISDISSEKTALFLKLFHSISVRRMTEDFEFGKPHTRAEIGRYFAALLGDSQREYTYIMIYDEKRRVTCCDFVSEGTVNTTSLPPRRVIEIAKQRGAVGVSVCHNHPGGSPTPSNVDIDTTKLLFRLFRTVGIGLYDHYVIARGKYCVIGISDDGEETITVSEEKELFPKKTHTYN